MKTILVQGAMEEELYVLMQYYKPQKQVCVGEYQFYFANYKNATIIISNTNSGIINATMATTIAILNFKPDIVVNQGCAGAYLSNLNLGDIVIGESSAYINDFKQPSRLKNQGSNSLTWVPNRKRSYKIFATKSLVEIANKIHFDKPKVVGRLGSGDVFSKEIDRINFLHNTFETICEDMESVAVYKVCENFNIPKIGFRVIANNEVLGLAFDKSLLNLTQEFTIKFIDEFLKIN